MELFTCPICGHKGLRPRHGYKHGQWGHILCENEDFIHLAWAGKHYLARTPQNIQEELNQKDLVLN